MGRISRTQKSFFEWLSQLEKDFSEDSLSTRLLINENFRRSFGNEITKNVFKNIGEIHKNNSNNSNMSFDKDIGVNDYNVGNKIVDHNFYGGEED